MNKDVASRPRILLVVRAIIMNGSDILLIQRSKNDGHEQLQWEIPGGKLDKGQDFGSAIERELIEEVGTYATPISKLAYFDSDIDGSSKYKGIPYIRMVSLYRCENRSVRLSSEHDDYKWVAFEDALKMDLTGFSRKALLAWEKEITNITTN